MAVFSVDDLAAEYVHIYKREAIKKRRKIKNGGVYGKFLSKNE